MAAQDDTFGLTDESINGKTPPSRKVLDWLHVKVSTEKDTDTHHTVGTRRNQVSRGDHDHDGENSLPLFDDLETQLPDLAGGATLAQVITAVNLINAALRSKGAGG